MQAASDDGWGEDDCPRPHLPPMDLPDYPAPEPVDGVDEATRAARNRNVMDGQIALAILHELRTTTPVGPISPRAQVAAEIGAALALGSGAAIKLVDISVALRDRLPATLRAVCAGSLSWYKASILAELTAPLTDEQTRQVEDLCLPKAAGRTPAQHRDAVRRPVPPVHPHPPAPRRTADQ